jgi:hypothetical protein
LRGGKQRAPGKSAEPDVVIAELPFGRIERKRVRPASLILRADARRAQGDEYGAGKCTRAFVADFDHRPVPDRHLVPGLSEAYH